MTIDPPLPIFFLQSLSYDVAALTVILSVDGHPAVEARFNLPRAFRSYSESDYYDYLGDFDGRLLLASTDQGCGIWMSDTAPYLLDYREHARWQVDVPETTYSCLIKTPQECVEIICFEEPSCRTL